MVRLYIAICFMIAATDAYGVVAPARSDLWPQQDLVTAFEECLVRAPAHTLYCACMVGWLEENIDPQTFRRMTVVAPMTPKAICWKQRRRNH
jgi:hypothetical protein